MYLLFVDESGTPPKPNSAALSHFVIAGLVIPEDRWPGMNDKTFRAEAGNRVSR